jgi:hypothetical protein
MLQMFKSDPSRKQAATAHVGRCNTTETNKRDTIKRGTDRKYGKRE